jgi:hypothetical protein
MRKIIMESAAQGDDALTKGNKSPPVHICTGRSSSLLYTVMLQLRAIVDEARKDFFEFVTLAELNFNHRPFSINFCLICRDDVFILLFFVRMQIESVA